MKNKKIKILIFVLLGVLLTLALYCLARNNNLSSQPLQYGITFSAKQAESLGFDWKTVYLAALDELDIKKIRLVAYWNKTEPTKGEYNWNDLDWQINEAAKRNAEVILAIGARLPRWPECHYPDWIDQDQNEDRELVLDYLQRTITRYQDNQNIIAWQIENEPFLNAFGECPRLDPDLLDREIALAKKIDDRPIIITDSGELSLWYPAARRADIFGTTMYRDTYSKQLKRYIHYPITPGFFRLKKNLVSWFAHPQEWIVIELQGEPWGPAPFQNLSQADRDRTMNPQKFDEIIDFAEQTGFNEFYLWGVEWWYWEREQGRPEMWEKAKSLFIQPNN